MSGNLYISSARVDDLESIMSLEQSGFAEGIIEQASIFFDRISVFPDGFLLARLTPDSEPIGYICSELWTLREPIEESRFELNHGIDSRHSVDGNEIYVSSMTIDPSMRSKGYGRELFATCISRLSEKYPGTISALLIVNEAWSDARKIYNLEGFVELCRIKHFFTPNGIPAQDGIVMRRTIYRSPSESVNITVSPG